jgi:hypothetical protein
MPKIIDAAPSHHRENAEEASLLQYVLGSGVFLAGLVGLFTVAGFSF